MNTSEASSEKRSRVVCLHNKGHSVCQLQKSQCFILLIILSKTLTFTYSGTGSTEGRPTADTHITVAMMKLKYQLQTTPNDTKAYRVTQIIL